MWLSGNFPLTCFNARNFTCSFHLCFNSSDLSRKIQPVWALNFEYMTLKKRYEYNTVYTHMGFLNRLLINLHWTFVYRQVSLSLSLNPVEASISRRQLNRTGHGGEIESWNGEGWKRSLRSSSPLFRPPLLSQPLTHIPECYIYMTFEYFQVGWFHHLPGQPIWMHETDLICLKMHLLQVPGFVQWLLPNVLGSMYFDQKSAECL